MNDAQPNQQIRNRLLWIEAILVVACFPLLLDALEVITLSSTIRMLLRMLLFILLAVIGMRFWQRAQRRRSI
jgi:hypothetical protein